MHDDDMIRAVKEFRNRAREAVARIEQNTAAAIADDKAKIERARKFMKETEIDRALLKVWDSVRHYPSWSQRADFDEKSNPLGFSEISGASTTKGNDQGERVGFKWEGHSWEIMFIKNQSSYVFDDTGVSGHLGLSFDNETVFQISIYQQIKEYSSDWKPLDVDALTPGEWVTYLVQLHEFFETEGRKYSAKFSAEQVSKHAAGMKLPPPLKK